MDPAEKLLLDSKDIAYNAALDMYSKWGRDLPDMDFDDFHSLALIGLWEMCKKCLDPNNKYKFSMKLGYTGARNNTIDYIRKLYGRERQRFPILLSEGQVLKHEQEPPSTTDVINMSKTLILDNQAMLSPLESKVMFMLYIMDFTAADCARIFDCTDSNISLARKRALEKFRTFYDVDTFAA